MTTALEVKNINKKYKNKVVLNDINFSIQSGEIVALIGKNGAGKYLFRSNNSERNN